MLRFVNIVLLDHLSHTHISSCLFTPIYIRKIHSLEVIYHNKFIQQNLSIETYTLTLCSPQNQHTCNKMFE